MSSVPAPVPSRTRALPAARPFSVVRTLIVAVAAVAALLAPAGASAAPAPSTPGASGTPVVLPVWALLDGDTPLSHARVRVFADGTTTALAQTDGRTEERVYGSGVALLQFAALPQAFTVEIDGARPGGRALTGTFRADVAGYATGDVVMVTPMTTLTAARVDEPDDVSASSASRKVHDLLAVPTWQDATDLRASDSAFDGDAYLRAARAAGGADRLNRALIRDEMRSGDLSSPFLGREPAQTGRAATVDWLGLLAGNPKALVTEAFKAIALLAGEKVAGLAAEKAGNAALGWVLAAFGYGDVLKDQDMQEIKLALDALGKQLTQVQGQVQLGGFSTLVHQTDRTIGQIDHASNQLALLTATPASDATKGAFTTTIVDYIGANLLDAPEILNQNLGTAIPLSDNLLKSASRVVAQRTRFFDAQTSASVRSVYDYFAAYQVKLALLLTEYFHAKPAVYSPTNVTATLARVEGNVRAQEGSLKPDVPKNAVVDTKSNRMWTQDYGGAPEVNMHEVAEIYKPRTGRAYFRTRQPYGLGPKTVPGLPHGNWLLPGTADYAGLIDGWKGANAAEWLRTEGRISKRLLDASDGQMWERDDFHFYQGTWPSVQYGVFDLRRGERRGRGGFSWFFADGWREDFTAARAGRLFFRDVPGEEQYWWR